nr:MAG TPA: Myb-like DNA-binding domain [Caudoviricetes sp.]
MTDRDRRVVRDDGKAFVSLEAAGAATYGRLRCGAGIARAIRTGGKAGGHRWRYARGCEPREEGPDASRGRWTERERWRLATLWPRHGRDWEGWAEALPGRTPDAIEAMARKMGLRPKPRRGAWTRAEETVLLRGLMDMARETGRTPGAIVTRLGHLRSAAKREERGVR